MKNKTKRLMSGAAALAIAMSLAQTAVFAEGEVDYNFNDQTQTLNLGDGGVITCGDITYTGTKSYTAAASGKQGTDDYAITAAWSDMPYTAWGVGGFEIPYYSYYLNNAGDIRTVELSFKYSEGCDYAVLQSSLATNPTGSHDQWTCTVDWVKFDDGKVYVVKNTADGATTEYTDTGIKAEPDKWYRIVVEAHFQANESIVYINGNKFELNELPNAVRYIRWTQARLGMDATEEEGSRDVSVSIDDVKVYTGAYQGEASNMAVSYSVDSESYSEDTGFAVESGTTAKDILDTITVNNGGGKYIISSLSSTAALGDSDAVTDGSIAVVTSPDGKTYEYIDIAVSEPEHKAEYSGTVQKITGTGEEANDVGFYGTCTASYADVPFGFTVTMPDADGEGQTGTADFAYDGTVSGEGGITFGLIIRGLSAEQAAGVSAEYLQ